MARFNGISGNVSSMIEQLQKMRKQMKEQTKAFESKEFEATASGGAVRVAVIGGREISKITLGKDTVDPDNVEILEDLIKTAVSEALHMAEAENRQMMGKLTGGLPL